MEMGSKLVLHRKLNDPLATGISLGPKVKVLRCLENGKHLLMQKCKIGKHILMCGPSRTNPPASARQGHQGSGLEYCSLFNSHRSCFQLLAICC